ncbi:hypothetical protein C1I98_18170 [Spongiactinospora gelatinilytica]|uniref:Uncharacterized protein n=1 Tax=Spongiactinospora gelatinilytica TaxID=2666298 RepID=A0A2W2H1B3_9ACTN|nr:hypothetical protein C1I98_18170 [Spongiactinospora gelatinilytica]
MAEPAELRKALLGCSARRGDALFELTDAVPAVGPVPPPPHLSLDHCIAVAMRDLPTAQHTTTAHAFSRR